MYMTCKYTGMMGAALLLLAQAEPLQADEFTSADLQRWQQQYMSVVEKGEKLFHGGLQSKNTVSCDQCHPDASNTHTRRPTRNSSSNSARWRYWPK